MTRKILAQFVLKNENLYIYYLHYSKVHFKKLFQRMLKRWCRIDAPDHWPFDEWDFSPDHSLSNFQKSDFIQLIAHYQKWVHFNSPLNKCSFFWCYWTNNLNSLLACRKVSDLRFYLKVESEVVSCLLQSMVWNALLPIKCQFVSNCHVRSKT